jgi:hypothetical protein
VSALRRAHDVGEENSRENAIDFNRPDPSEELADLIADRVAITDRRHAIVSRELHELRARDVLGEIAPLLDTRHAVTGPVHD